VSAKRKRKKSADAGPAGRVNPLPSLESASSAPPLPLVCIRKRSFLAFATPERARQRGTRSRSPCSVSSTALAPAIAAHAVLDALAAAP
jgi:hypothetical protein